MNARTPVLALAVIATVVAVGGLRAQQPPRFDHLKHAGLFPTCTGCHQGAEDPEQPILPDSAACATCHDGTTRPYVAWQRPAEGRPSNLKFAHELVPLMTRETPQGTQTLSCEDCHIAPGGQRMAVRRATPEGCLACHGPGVTQHLAAVIEQVLAFSSLDEGRETVRPTDFLGADIVRATAAVVEPLARQKHLAFTYKVPDAPIRMTSDVDKIRQILVNLAGNAIKFTEEGEVRLELDRCDGSVCFTVRDTGIGIAPRDLERLFKPFAQLDTGLTRRHGGSGLGLYISRGLAELLGGRIEVRSEPGKGSSFRLVLPVDEG